MQLQRILSGDPSRTSIVYLSIGAISLVKAIALRKDSNRFKRELLDAGLFLGIGIALRRYGQMKEQKRTEIRESVPDWAIDLAESQALRDRAMNRFRSEPEPEPSVGDRARRLLP